MSKGDWKGRNIVYFVEGETAKTTFRKKIPAKRLIYIVCKERILKLITKKDGEDEC